MKDDQFQGGKVRYPDPTVWKTRIQIQPWEESGSNIIKFILNFLFNLNLKVNMIVILYFIITHYIRIRIHNTALRLPLSPSLLLRKNSIKHHLTVKYSLILPYTQGSGSGWSSPGSGSRFRKTTLVGIRSFPDKVHP